MNIICDKCKYVSGFSSEFPCNRCVVIAINCFVPNNAALNSEELAATVPAVAAANKQSDEIKPCGWQYSCGYVRVNKVCKGPTCNIYDPV